MQIGALADFLFFVFGRVFDFAQLIAFPSGQFRFGILDVARHIVHEFFEGVRATQFQIAAAIAVGIDVGDGMLAQLLGVRLDPFRRAEQAGFFAIP